MKVIKSIVDNKNKLIGFWLEGKESEFGSFGSPTKDVQRPVQIIEMVNTGFKNNQLAVKNGKLSEQGGFKINELPMTRYDGAANFREVDNKIFLNTRIVREGKLIGFKVLIAGLDASYRYDDVIRLTRWFRPGNFVIRTIGEKLYIAGKPGVLKLEDLPEEILGENVQRAKKKRLGTGGQTKENINAKGVYNDKDLLRLYDIIKEFDGIVVKLPNEQYIPATKVEKQTAEEFRELGVGEFAYPYIEYGEKKMNANTRFKKPGLVMVQIPQGIPYPTYAYLNRTKSIFLNGENYIKRLGIGIKPEGINKIREEYEAALAIKPIHDKDLEGPVTQLANKGELAYFEVDTSKLSILSPDKAASYILPNKEIKDTVYQLTHAKLHNKYCKDLMGQLLEQANVGGIRLSDRKPYSLYGGLSPEYLKAIHDAGIDIFTGSYNKTIDVQAQPIATVEKDEDAVAIEIEYQIKGMDINKITAKMVAEKTNNKLIDEFLLMQVDRFNAIKDTRQKFIEVSNYQEQLEKTINECRRKLWMHKMGMFYTQEGRVHQHDKDMWIENVKSRAKANIFDCVEPDCEGLYVAISGITI